MLKIRLQKVGKSIKRKHHFRIAVAEARRARDSKAVEHIGYYDPSRQLLKIDIEKYNEWIKKGAQPTTTVHSLFKRYKKQLTNKNSEGEK